MLLFSVPGCGPQVMRAPVCTPHVRELCYSGPPGTEGVGHCRAGLRTCAEDGSGFGPCINEVLPASEVCGEATDANCDGKAGACTGDAVWAKRITTLEGYSQMVDLSVDGMGNVAAGISFGGKLDLGAPFGIFDAGDNAPGHVLLKWTPAGEPIFATPLDGYAWLHAVESDKVGNTIAVAWINHPVTISGQTFTPIGEFDELLFSLNPEGNLNFGNRIHGQDYAHVEAAGVNPAGDIVISGFGEGTVDLSDSASANDTVVGDFLARFDRSGAFVFGKELPSAIMLDTQFDSQGNILLGGALYDDANFGGDTLKCMGQDCSFVAKLGPSGEHLWSKPFGSNEIGHASRVVIAPDREGNVYMSGYFSDTWDFGGGPVTAKEPDGKGDAFLVKLDPDGNYVWGKYFGSGSPQNIFRIAVDGSGNVVIGGHFFGSIDFGAGTLYASSTLVRDIVVAKFSPDGNAIWSKRYGAGHSISIDGLAIGPAGEIVLAGDVTGDIDFGSGVLPAQQYIGELFVVKLEP